MMVGSSLAAGMDFKHIIIATILGNIFLSIVATLNCIIASKTGLSFALLTRYSFGSTGSKVATFLSPIINTGWYTIQSAVFGHFIAQIFGFGTAGEFICMILSALAMGIFAIFGMRIITILGYVSIPAIVFLCLATGIRSAGSIGGMSAVFAYKPTTEIAMGVGVTAIIGNWVTTSSTALADVMRFAKSLKSAIIASIVGLMCGNVLMIICGSIASIATQNGDLTSVLLGFGLLIPSVILMTTNIFTTNATNLYCMSLCLTNTFKLSRRKMLVIVLIIASVLTLFRPYRLNMVFSFLKILGVAMPPLAGILFSDFYLVHKSRYITFEKASFQKWNPISWISWAATVALVYAIPYGLKALNGIILSAVIYTLLMLVTKTQIVRPAEAVSSNDLASDQKGEK